MHQTSGPITDRLIAEYPAGSAGWTYHRDDETTDAVADEGYRLGRRWKRTPFLFALLNICGPTWALMLLIGVTQAAELGYLR